MIVMGKKSSTSMTGSTSRQLSRVAVEECDECEPQQTERSQTAKEIADLQERILRLARDRERLPQPLFWSLFNSRIQEIKKEKELKRLLSDVLG
jgi:hypothetical protein